MERRPDVDDEDVGIRAFGLRKQRAVERAVEKVRHHLGKKWATIRAEDIEVFEWALGETWSLMGFKEWESLSFSSFTLDTVEKIIETAREIIDRRKGETRGLGEIQTLLKA